MAGPLLGAVVQTDGGVAAGIQLKLVPVGRGQGGGGVGVAVGVAGLVVGHPVGVAAARAEGGVLLGPVAAAEVD